MSVDASPDTPLVRWLHRRGLEQNPFAAPNAGQDANLPRYFVDVGRFDELLRLTEPCVVFARRGCGKTAHRQMLAAECRPSKPDNPRLAIVFSYSGFEQVFIRASGRPPEPSQPDHHVATLLNLGLVALIGEAQRDEKVKVALEHPSIAPRLADYIARFAPHLNAEGTPGLGAHSSQVGTLELLQDFSELIRASGLGFGVYLIDELDEYPPARDDPEVMLKLLAPLLGTLPLIESSGLVFKFFLPQEIETTLVSSRWFRPDRLRIFNIEWTDNALQRLIEQRLRIFSKNGDRAIERLGQLCSEELASYIDKELAHLSNGLPRNTVLLANELLNAHCEKQDPPELIASETWKSVKDRWLRRPADFLETSLLAHPPAAAHTEESPTQVMSDTPEWPAVYADESIVRLGGHDITGEITRQDHRVLACLYRHHPNLCGKILIISEAWSDSHEGISDAAIAASISRLRKCLRQPTPYRGYIETVKGRGYKLHPSGF